jgi:hypothetical protein
MVGKYVLVYRNETYTAVKILEAKQGKSDLQLKYEVLEGPDQGVIFSAGAFVNKTPVFDTEEAIKKQSAARNQERELEALGYRELGNTHYTIRMLNEMLQPFGLHTVTKDIDSKVWFKVEKIK